MTTIHRCSEQSFLKEIITTGVQVYIHEWVHNNSYFITIILLATHQPSSELEKTKGAKVQAPYTNDVSYVVKYLKLTLEPVCNIICYHCRSVPIHIYEWSI